MQDVQLAAELTKGELSIFVGFNFASLFYHNIICFCFLKRRLACCMYINIIFSARIDHADNAIHGLALIISIYQIPKVVCIPKIDNEKYRQDLKQRVKVVKYTYVCKNQWNAMEVKIYPYI
jgi:hypothetical protein